MENTPKENAIIKTVLDAIKDRMDKAEFEGMIISREIMEGIIKETRNELIQ